MKLSTLKYFIEVATEKSFTRASEKLFISQPTLSRRINELENELGVTLLIRQKYSLKLSVEGEKFFIETTKILEQIDQLSHMFTDEDHSKKLATVLKIGVLPNFNIPGLYERLDQFKVAHPNVQFLISPDTPMNLADGVTTGRYDLVFCLSSYFQSNTDVEISPFMENNLQIALPINHPLVNHKKLKFADLKQETFILLERKQSPIVVDYVVNQGMKNGFNLRADYYVKDLDEGLSTVSLGKGLAFLYSGMNDGTLEEKYNIKILDLEDIDHDQNIVSAFDKKNNNQFLKELSATLKH
ncbi:LysR family transcriptional regulator [Dellaglioa algida]|uniref:LysR family transcriptional regulator n=1 Tax=Dellaglioa algida TaxID=105612 RepID=A0A2C8EQC5_9LACO|nr:LysR family transcriptional regulator [Dellaglioa algida]MDK1716144.1 LysR family transcriptional regulator [Dellaglioa algida]MDK1717833.1 LysR family transcriptional regulator [Dellaglioa algida]MDK1719425.1 LysR family transcriptional regulator [Dellaglioa algida]MDK1721073.1 LysR family transcriptional regulator [Dellaglioa algida]MDK1722768.1 LysR family transcriptional regulator [Dellaglioa algida]